MSWVGFPNLFPFYSSIIWPQGGTLTEPQLCFAVVVLWPFHLFLERDDVLIKHIKQVFMTIEFLPCFAWNVI